jgi:small Trp-rich protein
LGYSLWTRLLTFNAILGESVDVYQRLLIFPGSVVMYFLGLGLILLLLKFLELGPVATWSWWVVLAPFGLAVAWWTWADWSGYTKRREMEKMEQRKRERIERSKEALGMTPRRRR